MDAKNELYLEYARCINMCKGTEAKPWEFVRLVDISGKFDKHPRFESSPDCYKFAIFILEGKQFCEATESDKCVSASKTCNID